MPDTISATIDGKQYDIDWNGSAPPTSKDFAEIEAHIRSQNKPTRPLIATVPKGQVAPTVRDVTPKPESQAQALTRIGRRLNMKEQLAPPPKPVRDIMALDPMETLSTVVGLPTYAGTEVARGVSNAIGKTALGEGYDPVTPDSHEGQKMKERVGFGLMFLPGFGQSAMAGMVVDTARNAQKKGVANALNETARGLIESANPLHATDPFDAVMRSLNAVMLGLGGAHLSKATTKALKGAYDLRNPNSAVGIVAKATGLSPRDAAKALHDAEKMAVTTKAPVPPLRTVAADPKQAPRINLKGKIEGQTVDMQGFGNELPVAGGNRKGKMVPVGGNRARPKIGPATYGPNKIPIEITAVSPDGQHVTTSGDHTFEVGDISQDAIQDIGRLHDLTIGTPKATVPIVPEAPGQTGTTGAKKGRSTSTVVADAKKVLDETQKQGANTTAELDALKETAPDATATKPPATQVETVGATRSGVSAEGKRFTEERMNPNDIGVMDGLQFKKSGITDKVNNVTESLKGAEVYDQSAPSLSVWETKDGKRYVVDGHHRRELAIRAGAEDVPVHVYRESEGVTFEDARDLGVLKNLKDGKGTPLDIAIALRSLNYTPEGLKKVGVSTKSKLAKQGTALAALHPDALKFVENGSVKEDVGAGIGSVEMDRGRQMAAMNEAKRKSNIITTESEARRLAERIKNMPEKKKSGSDQVVMFEDELDPEFAVAEMAKLEDSVVRSLMQDKRLSEAILKGRAHGETVVDADAQAQAAQISEFAHKALGTDREAAQALEDAAHDYATNPTNENLAKARAKVLPIARAAAERRLNELFPSKGRESLGDGTRISDEVAPKDALFDVAPEKPKAEDLTLTATETKNTSRTKNPVGKQGVMTEVADVADGQGALGGAPKKTPGKFSPDDKLVLNSPHTDFEQVVSYRGPGQDGKSVVWDSKSQYQIDSKWLRHHDGAETLGEKIGAPNPPKEATKAPEAPVKAPETAGKPEAVKPDPRVIAYGHKGRILNMDQMARGTGAGWMIVTKAHTGELIAKQWARKADLSKLKDGESFLQVRSDAPAPFETPKKGVESARANLDAAVANLHTITALNDAGGTKFGSAFLPDGISFTPETIEAYAKVAKAYLHLGKEVFLDVLAKGHASFAKGGTLRAAAEHNLDAIWEKAGGEAETPKTETKDPNRHDVTDEATKGDGKTDGGDDEVALNITSSKKWMEDSGIPFEHDVKPESVAEWRQKVKDGGYVDRALDLAKEVEDGKRKVLDEVETLAITEKARLLKNELSNPNITRERLVEVHDQLLLLGRAGLKSGTGWGRGGVAKRVSLSRSLEAHIIRARAEIALEKTKGRKVTPEEKQDIADRVEELGANLTVAEKREKKAQDAIPSLEEQAKIIRDKAKKVTSDMVKAERAVRSVERKAGNQSARAENKAIRQVAASNILKKLGRAPVGAAPFEGLRDIVTDIKDITKSLIGDGVTVFDDVVNGVVTTIKELTGWQLSENDVHRALGGLEDPAPKAPSEASQHMSRIKSLSYLSGRIMEVLDESYVPPERRTLDVDVKALRKQYNDLLKERGLVSGKGMTREVRLMNSIAHALHVLEFGYKERPPRTPDTAREAELVKQLAEIRKEVRAKWNNRIPKSEGERIAAIEKQLADIQARKPKLTKPQAIESAKLKDARARLNEARTVADLEAKMTALETLGVPESKTRTKGSPKVEAYRQMYQGMLAAARRDLVQPKQIAKMEAELASLLAGNEKVRPNDKVTVITQHQARIAELRKQIAKANSAIETEKKIADMDANGLPESSPTKERTEPQVYLSDLRSKLQAKQRAEELRGAIGDRAKTDALLTPKARRELDTELLAARSEVKAAKKALLEFHKSYQYKPFFDKVNDWANASALFNVAARGADLAANTTKAASKVVSSPISSRIARSLGSTEQNLLGAKTIESLQGARERVKQDIKDVWAGKDIDSQTKMDLTGVNGATKWKRALSTATAIPGRMAGITDAPFKDFYQSVVYNDFATVYAKGDKTLQKQVFRQLHGMGDGPLSPAEVARIQAEGHEAALRETFNTDNVSSKVFADWDRVVRETAEKWYPGNAGKELGSALAFGMKIFTRFSRVIGNVAWERAMRSPAGAAVGWSQMSAFRKANIESFRKANGGTLTKEQLQAFKKSNEYKLTDAQARVVADNFTKGLTGTAMMAVGYFLAQNGNISVPVTKTKSGQYIDWGDFGQLGGFLSPILFGASLHAYSHDSRIKNPPMAMAQLTMDQLLDQPATSGPKNLLDLAEARTAGPVLNRIGAQMVVPAGLADIAKRLDAYHNPGVKGRKIKTFRDAIDNRIPVLREGLRDRDAELSPAEKRAEAATPEGRQKKADAAAERRRKGG